MPASPPIRISGRHYRSGRVVSIEIAAGRIASVREAAASESSESNPAWIAPGFVDVQVNGYGGQEFSSSELTAEKVIAIARRQAVYGVTRFCPTITTAARETILHGMRAVAEAARTSSDVAYAMPGIHLEGPFISPDDGPRGAHPTAHCRPPDWDEFRTFQDAAEGRIRLVTLSPEYRESPDFILRAVASGVVVAIGHMNATADQIRAAVDAGARLSTHLGNGAHGTLRRHPNYLWDQLAEDRLWASLIVDGHHLPPEVVQTFVRAKTPQRCLLVSDLSGMAGLPPGRYATSLCDLELKDDGRLVLAGQDQLLAGASLGVDAGIANVMQFAAVDLATAVDMASRRPAELLGLPVNRLEAGAAADLVVFRLPAAGEVPARRLQIEAVYTQGQAVLA